MEWTSPGAQQTRFNMGSSMSHAPQQEQQEQQNDGMELDELSPAGPGVSNLIARFEGIRAAPPSSSKVSAPSTFQSRPIQPGTHTVQPGDIKLQPSTHARPELCAPDPEWNADTIRPSTSHVVPGPSSTTKRRTQCCPQCRAYTEAFDGRR
ncbi:hypothetical protein CGMCC3_g573 [Colletotrichum fructicola]|nr:uncharacterized protein CGMCC3_g573 [Colletotrichum fructicola]KAE9583488.1 hypothetical protein CGMCC3_g573 [Colletotrichum fructicola]